MRIFNDKITLNKLKECIVANMLDCYLAVRVQTPVELLCSLSH